MSYFGARYPCDAEPDNRPGKVTVFVIGGDAVNGLPWSEKQKEPPHRVVDSGGGWSMEAKVRIGRYRIDYFANRKPGDQVYLSTPLSGGVMCANEDEAKARAVDDLRAVIADLQSHL